MIRSTFALLLAVLVGCQAKVEQPPKPAEKAKELPLLAGAAKVDITSTTALPANDQMFARALVLKRGDTTAVIVSVDAVAIGEIGYIGNDFLPKLREKLQKELKIEPGSVMVNASHCHGIVRPNIVEETFQAVKEAAANMVPVRVGVGTATETRISENRRVKLKNGKEADVRHAYSLPPDSEVVGVGPIDPQVGLLRLDRADGKPLAVVYNFACHPIMGVPNGGNTADITGFSSKVIESNLEGSIALFVQGCGGDINPVGYKEPHIPRHAEALGNMLGLTVLDGVRKIRCSDDARLAMIAEKLDLPRADHTARIDQLLAEQAKLVKSLKGTSLDFKTFLPLYLKYELGGDYPSAASHRYLNEKTVGRDDLASLDAGNRRNLKAYLENIQAMEALTRNQINLALLQKHQAAALAAGRKPIETEAVGLRVGEFVMVTSPGELTVEIGLNIKKASPHRHTFVAGYTNGYIYYAPTAEQLKNVGNAQEDSDCRLAPEWQKLFEEKAAEILKKL